MKFQLFVLRTSKLGIIALIFIAICLLLNSTPGEAFWGKKVKEITDDELKEIKTELNLSQDSRFRAYSDSDLEDALNKEMDKGKTPGLTYGVYILNAINEQELVDLLSKSYLYDKEATQFFSALADSLAVWQENFAAEVTKTTLEAVIKACGASGVSIGISSLFLALDLAKIQVSIKKLEEVIRKRALWHYIASRKLGDSHESAWGSAPVPIKYRNKQTEDYFKSLWGKYGKHMSEDGLDEDFKQQQREKLTILLLYALGAQAHPVLTSPLEIAPSAPYYIGDKINAEFTITNQGVVPISFDVLTVGGRDPDDQVADFTFRHNITLGSNESYKYKGTITLPKAGKYHFFCAYQTPDSEWNPSIDLRSGLSDEDRIEDISVKAEEKKYPNRVVDILSVDQWTKIKSQEIAKYAYKINETFSSVLIMRTSDNAVISKIPIGKGFVEGIVESIAITPDGKYVYVDAGEKKMAVIQTSDNTVIDKIPLSYSPYSIAITPDGKYVYALHYEGLAIIRTSDNQIIETIYPRGSPRCMAMSPDGKYVYLDGHDDYSHFISVLRTQDNKTVNEIPVPYGRICNLIVAPDSKHVYFNRINPLYGNASTRRLSVITTADNRVTDLGRSEYAWGAWKDRFGVCWFPKFFSPDGKYSYGPSGRDFSKIAVVRTSDNTLMHEIDLGYYSATTITPDGTYIYATCQKGDKIAVLRTSDNRIVEEISPVKSPTLTAITPDGEYLYVASYEGDTAITVLRTSDTKVIEEIPRAKPFIRVAVTPQGEYVCVTKGNTAAVIRTSDDRVISKISLESITGIAITPDGRYIYAIQKEKPVVSVMRTSDSLLVTEIPLEETPSHISMTSDGKYVHVSLPPSDQKREKKPITSIKIIRTLDNTVIDSIELYSPSSTITPDGNYVYFISEKGVAISVIRASDNEIIDTIYLKGQVKEIVFSANGEQAYVVYRNPVEEIENVAVIGISGIPIVNSIIDAIPVEDNPVGLGLTPDGKYLYVANRGSNSISVVRISDSTVMARTYVLSSPLDIAITPDGKYVYVVHRNGDLVMISASDNKVVDTVTVEETPGHYDIAITPDGKYLYLTTARLGSVVVLQISDNRFIDEFSAKGTPIGIAITPDGKYAYVSNYDENVAVIRISDNKVLQTLPVRAGGTVAITQDGEYAYVAGNSNIWVIHTSDNTIQEKISVPEHPFDVAITPDGKYLYISYLEGAGVIVIRTSDNTVVDGIATPGGVAGIIPAPNGKDIYVASPGTDEVFVIKSVTSPR